MKKRSALSEAIRSTLGKPSAPFQLAAALLTSAIIPMSSLQAGEGSVGPVIVDQNPPICECIQDFGYGGEFAAVGSANVIGSTNYDSIEIIENIDVGGYGGPVCRFLARDNRGSEDVNFNGVLDAGEDLNGNGLIDEDTGVFNVELLPGAVNMALTPRFFFPGDSFVEFDLEILDPALPAIGEVNATDGSGNACRPAFQIGGFDPFGGITRTPTRNLNLTLRRPSQDTTAARCVEVADPAIPATGVVVNEVEPNDSYPDEAQTVQIGDDFTGNSAYLYDQDYIAVEIPVGVTLTAALVDTDDSTFYANVSLMDADYNTLAGTYNYGFDGEVFNYTVHNAGTYYVRVIHYNFNGGDNAYRLQLRGTNTVFPDFNNLSFNEFINDPLNSNLVLSGGDGLKQVCCEFQNSQSLNSPPACGSITLEQLVFAPADVSGRGKPGKVDLVWAESQGAERYDVFRSSTASGPYDLIGSATSPIYIDYTAVSGSTMYYVVQTYANGFSSENSLEAAIPVPSRSSRRR